MERPVLLYGAVCAGTFLAVFLMTPACRWLANRIGALDHPDAARKVHRKPVPYLGGLAFYFAFLGLLVSLSVWAPDSVQPEFYPMALAGFVIVLMGVYDDIRDLTSKIKLPLELALGGALYFWGFKSVILSHPLGGTVHIGGFAIVVTAVWIAGLMNAINFSDGLDGLAAGLVCICAAALFAISYQGGRVASCILMAFLVGATLAFLCYNFHPATIFMGDAGALFLGFVLGASTLIERQKGVTVIALTIPVTVMIVPLVDTLLSFERRMRRARSGRFFTPDRGHLHHRLLALGLSQRQAVLALYGVSACMGVLAFILSGVSTVYRFLALLLAGAVILIAVAALRFMESRMKDKKP